MLFILCILLTTLNLKYGILCIKVQIKLDGEAVDLGLPEIDPSDLIEYIELHENGTQDLHNEEYIYNSTSEGSDEYIYNSTSKRIKRSSTGSSPGYDRKGPKCAKKLQMMQKSANGEAVQYSLLVETKETATLTCHFCGDPASEDFASMNWYRLQREHVYLGYTFKEVGLDMHDDESQNRVFKTVDHTLVIKKATEDDAGSYICHDFSTNDRLIKSSMTQEDIETILSDTDKFRFFYHLDVLRPSKIPVDEVSENGILTRSPSPPEVLEDKNLELFTDWQKWSRCSTCGKKGERKRLGVCVVKKADPDEPCDPWYIEAILSSNPTGVPCRSSVFTNHVDFKSRPDELLKETCKVKCTAANAGQGKALRISGLNDVLFGKKKNGMLKKTLKIEAGKDVFLICPGAQIDSVVMWLNNTRPLVGVIVRNLTNGRVDIDAHNILRIYRVTLKDDGKYQCIKDHKEQIEFRLKVFVDNTKEFWKYTGYLVLTYPLNFLLFVTFMIVKHRRYKVGAKLTDEQIALLNDLSSSPSLSTFANSDDSGSEDELLTSNSS